MIHCPFRFFPSDSPRAWPSAFPFPPSAFCFSAALCGLGLSAFLTQLVLIRELLSAFSGNELAFGIVLGNWMLLTAIGAALGKMATRLRSPITLFCAAEICIALLPIADVFLLRWLRNVVFLRGAEVGVTETVAACCTLLAPYCLATGCAQRGLPSGIGMVARRTTGGRIDAVAPHWPGLSAG